MKTNFVRNQKINETCLNPSEEFDGDDATCTAYFIDENETDIMLFIDEYNKGLPEDFKNLNLTCDGVHYLNGTQEIPLKYDEQVVILEKRDGGIYTCLGYEISLQSIIQ